MERSCVFSFLSAAWVTAENKNKREKWGKEKYRTQNKFFFCFLQRDHYMKPNGCHYNVSFIESIFIHHLSHITLGEIKQTNRPSKKMKKKKFWLKVDGGIKGVDDISQDQSQQHQYVCNPLVYGCTCNKIEVQRRKVDSFFFIDYIHQSNIIDISYSHKCNKVK